MATTWQLQEAKNRFSEVVEQALHNGPQTVTKHGREAVVIVSYEEFQRMRKPQKSLVDFFRDSPLYGLELDITRSKELPREIDFGGE